jgi:hypothetical protein
MGKITAHRARATIASALYNAPPEGLGIGELGQWLGHKDIRSTQYYAKLHPTRLAKSIARANRNSRLIQVLLDPAATAQGEPGIDGVLRLMQEVPLTDEEKSVAEGDVQALTRYIEGRKHVPPPNVPSQLYNFNSSMQPAKRSDSSRG